MQWALIFLAIQIKLPILPIDIIYLILDLLVLDFNTEDLYLFIVDKFTF